ncbi:uncharacterized protein LOC135839447 [Planococcus citri]|uniref:uncharacterized protein LOC135839447 n=1 Tax=Planococcus citri TaxID=170843 RepID=UPI0031FA103A
MTSEAMEAEVSSEQVAEEIVPKPSHLKELQQDIEQLQNDLNEKGKLIVDMEIEIQNKQSKLRGMQNLLMTRIREIQVEDITRRNEIEHEKEWSEKLKTTKIKRIASILEYKNKMNELREKVFSPLDLNDAKINEEIEFLMMCYEELSEKNKATQFGVDHLARRVNLDSEANNIIDNINVLIKQMKLETDDDRKMNEAMEMEIMVLDKKIRENEQSETND